MLNLKTKKTVFTNKELALIFKESNSDRLKNKIAYYVKRNNLVKLSRGIYSFDQEYDPYELATSIYAPSYISLETVLRSSGVIFQHYDSIFVVSHFSKKTTVNNHKIIFSSLKETILYNQLGIEKRDNYLIATTERAFLDRLYLSPDYHFDNLDPINFTKCQEIVKIYGNKELEKRLAIYAR